jgi:hypothetical protein
LGRALFRFINNKTHLLRHMVPLSTPLPLSQFIVIIETISFIIRPTTLSVRLAANITAGHILIRLVRSPIFILNLFSSVLLILIILEIAVAFIQRYVFTILMSIYVNETYDKSAPPLPHSLPKSLTYSFRFCCIFYTWEFPLLNFVKKCSLSFIQSFCCLYKKGSMVTRCFSWKIFSRISYKFSNEWLTLGNNFIYYIWNFVFFLFFLGFFSL